MQNDDPMELMCAVAAAHPPSPAKLMLRDLVLATGEARLEKGHGTYWTTAQNTQDNFPESGASLIVSGIRIGVTLTKFHRCPCDPPHYHFQYDSEHKTYRSADGGELLRFHSVV